jgi:glycosyltransferase involved in cell wall biosynthesis
MSGGKRLQAIAEENSGDKPLVTVVTAVYNGQPYIAGCLESVLRQDYSNIEHIVLDGGSNDGTVDVLREYGDRIALWRSEPDGGVYDAWNKALAEARGEWICFLGADDEFLPGAISTYMELAAKNPHAEYLSSRMKWVHPSNYQRIKGDPWRWRNLCMRTPHVGSMHRRTLFDRVGLYDTSYRVIADYELLLRGRGELSTAYSPVITVMMRAGGISSTKAFQGLDEAARAQVLTGRRNKVLVFINLLIQKTKVTLRPLFKVLGWMKSRAGEAGTQT